MNKVERFERDKEMAALRLISVSDLSVSNPKLSYHLEKAAEHINDERYVSNGLLRSVARLSNL